VSVAVAVVSWNTRDLLRACLESLHADADAGRAEVWVVDNASADGSAALVRSAFPWVRLLALDENLGFGRAVNRVAARTATAWVAPANADVAVEPGALRALVAAGQRDPGAGAVAPRLVLPDGSTQHSVYRFPTVPFTAAFNAGLYRVSTRAREAMLLEGMWDPDRPRVVDWAVGALLLVRRAPRGMPRAGSTKASGCTPRTSTWAGAWPAPAGARATSRRRACTTTPRRRPRRRGATSARRAGSGPRTRGCCVAAAWPARGRRPG
jgi:hypothetical protein